ncbi:hypothetical protein AB1E18_015204 [Capra hircus]
MNRSMPGLPVHHHLPEFTQTHVRRVSDAIQPSHPLSSPSPPAPNPSQHQSLFQIHKPASIQPVLNRRFIIPSDLQLPRIRDGKRGAEWGINVSEPCPSA